MSLHDRLKADLTVNLKARNQFETNVLRSLIGAIQTAEKAGKTSVVFTDSQVEALLSKEMKKRRDVAVEYANAGATERANIETTEADFIAQYLPAPLTETEVLNIIDEVINEHGTDAQFGLIMKNVVSKVAGRADGKTISTLVRAKLV